MLFHKTSVLSVIIWHLMSAILILHFLYMSETKTTDGKGKLRFIFRIYRKEVLYLNDWAVIRNAFYMKTVSKENVVSLLSSSSSLPPFLNEMEQSMPLSLLPFNLVNAVC